MSTLTIKDLPDSKELDRKAMSAIRGGFGLLSSSFGSVVDAIGDALATAEGSSNAHDALINSFLDL